MPGPQPKLTAYENKHNIKDYAETGHGFARSFDTCFCVYFCQSKEFNSTESVLLPEYVKIMKEFLSAFNFASIPEQIAKVIYEAATDNKDQVRYLAGEIANKTFFRDVQKSQRKNLGRKLRNSF